MGQVHIDADHQLKRPFGAFFHGDHIRFDQYDCLMRNDKTGYDFQDNFQDNFEDNFEGETLANPL